MARRKKPTTPERPAAPRAGAPYAWMLGVTAAAVLVYVNAIGNEFVLDDVQIIRDNVRIRSLGGIPELFASSYWGVPGAQALYRPLVLATYALNYGVHGLSPDGYVIVNIALHAAVSLLLFLFVRGASGSAAAAGIAALVFAVHPVHAEAVAGISGRPELLAASLVLAALLLHRRALLSTRHAIAARAGSLLCFAAALLSKESAMTLLPVIAVMDALLPVRGRGGPAATPRARLLGHYLPLTAVAIAYLLVRRAVLGGIVIADRFIAPLDNPLVPVATMPLGERLGATTGQAVMTAFAVIAEYARLLLWPARLSPDYSYNQLPLVTGAGDTRLLIGAAIVAACLAGIAALWRRQPVAAFGLAFLALTFSIVSNFVIRIGTICAERLVYLPSAGLCVAGAIAVERLTAGRPVRRRLAVVALVALLGAAAVRTVVRNRDWKDDATLWTAAIETSPGSARVQTEYGRVLMTRAEASAAAGRTDEGERLYAEAQRHLRTALAIYPSYSLALDELAMIASLHNRYDEAAPLYDRAMTAWPGNYGSLTNWASLQWDRSQEIGRRGMALRKDGRMAESDALLRQADAEFARALDAVTRAVAMMPSYPQAHLVRGMILASDPASHDAAVPEFEQVLRLAPDHPQRAAIEAELRRLKAPR